MKADLLRSKFLSFFKSKKHKIIESDSLAPHNDPTVLFTPAGMNQFKQQFLGVLTGFTRATTSQRCLRTDDLDKVGKTSGHHTFFEMLGNFSFGDYFKKEAISWAWEFLTRELKIPESKLWVSVYKDDDEAYGIWKDVIKLPVHKIIRLGDKDNFWPAEAKAKGPNGPCGPCSEIFYDYGADSGCHRADCTPACGCSRFVEIWNLVFTQFNRKEGGALTALPKKNIDTGMGLERLCAVMQGAKNNFETDLFSLLITSILREVKTDNPAKREFVYAIADHIRAIVFTMYDGVLPSNEARGYVVRKLIRKSSMHLRNLGVDKPFLFKLVRVLADSMIVPYPELQSRVTNILEIVLTEEKNFIATLETSDTLLEEKFAVLKVVPDPQKAGMIAFRLYDTYGLPVEITQDWLEKRNIGIDLQVFNAELTKQKERSKLLSTMKGDVFSDKEVSLGVKDTKFVGYKNIEAESEILTIIKDGKLVKKVLLGEEVIIVLDKTPFYAESGGQVADAGVLVKGKNIFEVREVKKSGRIFLHSGIVKAGSFKNSDMVDAKIDQERRQGIARNHTATHILQAVLRSCLGSHVQQQGSLVSYEKLRFDFTHPKELTRQELDKIEESVNDLILHNQQCVMKEMSLALAKKSGALAFFGEKYGEKVRVVSLGEFSKEFCGGTHLDSTGSIGIFKIVQEGSVAAGVRRIEAVTGTTAYKFVREKERLLQEASNLLSISYEKVPEEIQKRLARVKELEKNISLSKLDSAKESVHELIESAQDINGVKVIASVLDNLDMDVLRKTVDMIKQKTVRTVIALGSTHQGRALYCLGVTPDLIAQGFDACALIRETAQVIGGSGGGRKDFAQAGGNRPDNFPKAFEMLKATLGAR